MLLKKLDRYVISAHIMPFLGALLVFTTVLLLDKIFDLMDLLIRKGVPWDVVLKLFLNAMPFILALSVPMAVLVASLIAFGQMSQNFEIIAAKACGVSLKRLLVGPLVFAFFVFIIMAWFDDRILPESNHRFKNILIDIYVKKPSAQIKAGLFNTIKNFRIYVRNKDDRTSRIEDVRIFDLSDRGKTFITARYGFIRSFQDSIILFHLYDGTISRIADSRGREHRLIKFDSYTVRVKVDIGMRLKEREFRSDREMSISMLREEIKKKESQMKKVKDENTRRHLRNRINALWVEIYKKFSLPFGAVVFVLLAAPLASMIRRGGFGVALGISFIVFTIYYVLLLGGEELARRGLIHPFIAMWFPNFFFLIIALFLIWREERV